MPLKYTGSVVQHKYSDQYKDYDGVRFRGNGRGLKMMRSGRLDHINEELSVNVTSPRTHSIMQRFANCWGGS